MSSGSEDADDEDDDRDYTWVDPETSAATNPATDGPRDAKVTLAVGVLLADRYEVRAFIGEGGMGAVYLAFDRVLDDEVALKVVHARHAGRVGLRDEVRLAQRVTHPNVCRTYDLEEIDDRHVVKMEYVRGSSLATELAAHPRQSIARAVAIGRAIADGLWAAHAVGVVHRDLKPGNVMLAAGDRVVLMDFGLAQWDAGGGGAARSDYAGTPGYMSPEQMAGTAIDTRSDLYALGCVMFEMLAGERLLGIGTMEQVWRRQKALGDAVPDLRAKRPEVPRWLARAVRMLLARDPAMRSRGVRLLSRGGRGAWVWIGVGAAVVAAAAVVAGVVMASRGGEHASGGVAWTPVVAPVLPQFVENADDPTISPDDRWLAYMSDRTHPGVFAVFVQPREGGGDSHQISPLGMDCVRPQWTFTGDALMMACGAHEHFRLTRIAIDGARGLAVGEPVPLGDGRMAAACGPDAIATIGPNARSIGVAGRELATTREDLYAVACTRDGARLAYLAGDDVWIASTARGAPEPKQIAVSLRTSALAIAPDGSSVVFVRDKGGELTELVEQTLGDGAIHVIAVGDDHPYSAAISPDGKYLVFDRDVSSRPPFVLDANGARTQLSATLDGFESPSPSPRAAVDGTEWVAFARDDGKVVAIDGKTGALRVIGEGTHPFFDATGERVLFADKTDRAKLMSAPARGGGGGGAAVVATLPGELVAGVGAADGIHVEILRDSGVHEGWRIGTPSGVVTREDGADGLVIPAPTGGWRAILFEDSGDAWLRFVGPDGASAPARYKRMPGLPRWLDAHRFAYCDHASCAILDVPANTSTALAHPDFADELAVGLTGDHWYTSEYVGQVTRHVITNFAARPWAKR